MGRDAEPDEEFDAETRIDQSNVAPASPAQMNERAAGTLIDSRYLIRRTIGRGGMAVVYHVADLVTRREIALKQLFINPTARHHAAMKALFERELHTLASLSHPCIIEVHENGADDVGPFYTMELLEGQDLRMLSPLPWQQASALMYDVCSSLALIHSRRLVHRDVTPGNVQCTPDGHAKLIDFGAMVPMGPNDLAIGTPQFIAPEVLHRSSLDARTDLFSLGGTLYLALTGRAPYPARDFDEAKIAWRTAPLPPSACAAGIPAALDALTLALLAIDPAIRPRTAFDVMQRLAGIAGIERAEPSSVPLAYLSTPVLVGREEVLAVLNSEMEHAFCGRGRAVLVEGVAGIGRSRIVDAAARSANGLGMTVLWTEGSAALESFQIAANIMQQLLAHSPQLAVSAAQHLGIFDLFFEAGSPDPTLEGTGRPQLRAFPTSENRRAEIQNALVQWFSAICADQPLAILLDDYHLLDAPSAALFATLATQLESRSLFLLATVEIGASTTHELAVEVLGSHSTRVPIAPLGIAHTERLFESIFGNAPNLEMLSHGIYAIARGNPRSAMDMAQHLLDKGLVRYERGSWTLSASLEATDLPKSVDEAMRHRIDALSSLARHFAEAQALATHPAFSLSHYALLAMERPSSEVDRAIGELVSAQVVYGDGRMYTLAHRGWASVLVATLDERERLAYHRALVAVYEERSGIGMIRHALLGGLETLALDRLVPMLASLPETARLPDTGDLNPSELAAIFDLALSAAERIGRNPREINDLRRWLAALSVVSEDKYYFRVASAWHAQLRHDSGFDLFQHSTELDPELRLRRAMQLALERYTATPQAERTYRPDEAIKGLAHLAGISLAIGTSRLEYDLIAPFTASLEPFVPLSPLIHAIHRNTLATREIPVRPESARDALRNVYLQLGELASADQSFVDVFRRAIAHGIGSLEAQLGISQADRWADLLDDDPALRVNAIHLRRIVRLQQGDWEGAERHRRQAELVSLQVRRRQMFASIHSAALAAYVLARDLTGLKQTTEDLRALASNAAGWLPAVLYAEACFKLICDDPQGALAGFERACELAEQAAHGTASIHPFYCLSKSARMEALVALERVSEACAAGEAALTFCKELGVSVPSHWISRALALAEAKMGQFVNASGRLEAVIANQSALGISGLHLGATYEARARVAIWARDDRAIETYMQLTAREYRYGSGSALGARYERLREEARVAGATALPKLANVERSQINDTEVAVAKRSVSK